MDEHLRLKIMAVTTVLALVTTILIGLAIVTAQDEEARPYEPAMPCVEGEAYVWVNRELNRAKCVPWTGRVEG